MSLSAIKGKFPYKLIREKLLFSGVMEGHAQVPTLRISLLLLSSVCGSNSCSSLHYTVETEHQGTQHKSLHSGYYYCTKQQSFISDPSILCLLQVSLKFWQVGYNHRTCTILCTPVPCVLDGTALNPIAIFIPNKSDFAKFLTHSVWDQPTDSLRVRTRLPQIHTPNLVLLVLLRPSC